MQQHNAKCRLQFPKLSQSNKGGVGVKPQE